MSKAPLQKLFFLSLLFVLTCTSCGTTNLLIQQKIKKQQKKAAIRAEKQEKKEAPPVPQRLPIGIIHMVHPGGEFVLIQSGRNFHLDPGSEITTYNLNGSETATLEVSEASKGAFITADIISGKPGRGDRAVANYIPAKSNKEKTEDPAAKDDDVQVLE